MSRQTHPCYPVVYLIYTGMLKWTRSQVENVLPWRTVWPVLVLSLLLRVSTATAEEADVMTIEGGCHTGLGRGVDTLYIPPWTHSHSLVTHADDASEVVKVLH